MSRSLSWIFHVDSVPMTPAVVAGETSLGGSESACLGLARALQARGHRVTILAAKLSPDVPEIDAWGVRWLPADALRQAQILIDPDVFVALRDTFAAARRRLEDHVLRMRGNEKRHADFAPDRSLPAEIE